MLEGTTKFTGDRYEVGNAVEWTRAKPTEQLQLSLRSALLTGAKIPKGHKPEKFVSTVNRYRCRKEIRKDIERVQVKSTFGKEWYLPHHPVLNPNKSDKVRRVYNAASKYKKVCLNDKLLAGPDLLHGLIGTIFRFRQGPIALTADIESLFLQVQVPQQHRRCLKFLLRPRNCSNIRISASCF